MQSVTHCIFSFFVCPYAALQLAYLVAKHKIPKQLTVNADQTGANVVPVDSHTYAKVGAKTVRMVGLEDKRALTVQMAVSADGDTLPCQVIFAVSLERTPIIPLVAETAAWDWSCLATVACVLAPCLWMVH